MLELSQKYVVVFYSKKFKNFQKKWCFLVDRAYNRLYNISNQSTRVLTNN